MVVASLGWLAATPPAVRSCQLPPGPPDPPSISDVCELNASLVADRAVVRGGEAFQAIFTITNSATSFRGYPPPFKNDRLFDVEATACVDTDGDTVCDAGPPGCLDDAGDPVSAAPSDVVDPERIVLLDDAWAPSADDPTSATLVFTVLPRREASWYSVQVTVTVVDTLSRRFSCVLVTCVPGVPDTTPMAVPTAEFLEPDQSGFGGGVLPFALGVHRNGYPTDRPLTVRVTPENPYDPRDIFPMDPPDLATLGAIVTGDEEVVRFECHLHYPCFVGAYNAYAVTIHDGPALLWDSHWLEAPLGHAWVEEAPMAFLELVGMEQAGCGGRISACEGGVIHLRLYARNPYYGVRLDGVRLELPLPDGITVRSHQLHFHDNPMDDVTPSPAELAATGTVTSLPGLFRVDVGSMDPRFEGAPVAPRVFKDLFEVELFLDAPTSALAGLTELTFADLTVAGTSMATPVSGTASLSVPIGPDAPPDEIAAASPGLLRFPAGPDLLAWGDCGTSLVDSFDVFRGPIDDLRDARSAGRCIATGLVTPSLVDTERPGSAKTFVYLVAGRNCGGRGSLGAASDGAPRAPAEDCP
jgi:hypothetical protein